MYTCVILLVFFCVCYSGSFKEIISLSFIEFNIPNQTPAGDAKIKANRNFCARGVFYEYFGDLL